MPYTPVLVDSIAGRADARPSAFVCSWTDGGLDAAWVHVAGELDVMAVPQLERTLQDSRLQARLVVLDLRELESIDTAGVHAIVGASLRARLGGRRLVLLRGPQSIDRVFTLAEGSDEVAIGDVDPIAGTRVEEDVAS